MDHRRLLPPPQLLHLSSALPTLSVPTRPRSPLPFLGPLHGSPFFSSPPLETTMSDSLRVFTSNYAFLPFNSGPSPATLEVRAGKVTAVHDSVLPRSSFPGLAAEDYFDTGDKWLLPGVRWRRHRAYERGWLTSSTLTAG